MKNLKTKILLSVFFYSQFIFSQVDPPGDEDPPPVASIDSQIIVMLCVGIVLGLIFFILTKDRINTNKKTINNH